MPKFIDGISIPRKLVKVGILTKDAIFTKGGVVANLMLDGKEIDELPFQAQELYNTRAGIKKRGILFGINQDKIAMDLLNARAGLEYPAMNITPDLCQQQKKYDGYAISDSFSLDSLLEYLGFEDDELTTYELSKIRNILTSKKEIRKLALPCAYGKINTRKTHVLDYQQLPKIDLNKHYIASDEYYKFIGEQVSDSERCVFDKSVPTEIEQKIYPASLFELLLKNYNLGYDVTDKSEYDIVQKRLVRK